MHMFMLTVRSRRVGLRLTENVRSLFVRKEVSRLHHNKISLDTCLIACMHDKSIDIFPLTAGNEPNELEDD